MSVRISISAKMVWDLYTVLLITEPLFRFSFYLNLGRFAVWKIFAGGNFQLRIQYYFEIVYDSHCSNGLEFQKVRLIILFVK